MTAPLFRRLAVLGVGLLGGSFALAARSRGLVQSVSGFSATPATLQLALQLGVIDHAAASAAEACADADLVLLAVPVAATASVLESIREVLRPDALVLDVGSTKGDVVDAAAVLGAKRAQFVPSHPIAGAEVSGVQHADATLFDGRRTILTPLDVNPEPLLQRTEALWRAVGCADVLRLNPAQHDACFAAVSHLPHLLAFAYVDGLLRDPDGPARMALGGTGFRDFSRIAGGDPSMWRDVLLANSGELLRQLRDFRTALDHFESLLRAGDGARLQQAIAAASATRRAWGQHASDTPLDEPD